MKTNRYAFWALVTLALCLVAVFDVSAAMMIAPVAAVSLEELPELAGKLQKKTEEVHELGRQLLADQEAGRKTSDELKQKLDESLTGQGEIKGRITELEQALAKGLKGLQEADENGEDLG